ncbi:hypothetical protein OL548_06555 [Lysinibacillus sp. MHQ-1]|nr:hypothetical protein OL548_06555 [Lysinibacillus sp. MHQ-1]
MAVPSLLYSSPAPASAANVSGQPSMAYIYSTSYYNSNVSNVVQLINNINYTTSTFQANLEAALKAYNALTELEKTVCNKLLNIISTSTDKNFLP